MYVEYKNFDFEISKFTAHLTTGCGRHVKHFSYPMFPQIKKAPGSSVGELNEDSIT